MSYFIQLAEKKAVLDDLANEYMDCKPFISNDECCERIINVALKIFKDSGEDWESVPWWVADIADGRMPFYHIPKNGSLHFALGFSVEAFEANLRNLLEIAEGRELKEINLDYIVKK